MRPVRAIAANGCQASGSAANEARTAPTAVRVAWATGVREAEGTIACGGVVGFGAAAGGAGGSDGAGVVAAAGAAGRGASWRSR